MFLIKNANESQQYMTASDVVSLKIEMFLIFKVIKKNESNLGANITKNESVSNQAL